jgi:hypothetical protein
VTKSAAPRRPVDESEREQYVREGLPVAEAAIGEEELLELRGGADRIPAWGSARVFTPADGTPASTFETSVAGGLWSVSIPPAPDLSRPVALLFGDPRLVRPISERMGDEPVLWSSSTTSRWCSSRKQTPRQSSAGRRTTLSAGLGYRTASANATAPTVIQSRRVVGDRVRRLPSPRGNTGCSGFPPPRCAARRPAVDQRRRGTRGLRLEAGPSLSRSGRGSMVLLHSNLAGEWLPNRAGTPRRVMIYSHYPRSRAPAIPPGMLTVATARPERD